MMFYFLIMKYNLTNETFSREMQSQFPAATKMTFLNMLYASLIYNIVTMLISLVLYYPLYRLGQFLFKSQSIKSLILTGFLITLTTPIAYAFLGAINFEGYVIKAEIISWTLTVFISITTYVLLNKTKLNYST
jgi:hypothetical protein